MKKFLLLASVIASGCGVELGEEFQAVEDDPYSFCYDYDLDWIEQALRSPVRPWCRPVMLGYYCQDDEADLRFTVIDGEIVRLARWDGIRILICPDNIFNSEDV